MARRRKADRPALLLLDQAEAPVFLLDRDRRVIFANQACLAWLGTTLEAIFERRCDYRSPESSEPAELVCALCPPPDAFAGGACEAWLRSPVDPDDGRKVSFVPLQIAEGQYAVLGVLSASPSAEGTLRATQARSARSLAAAELHQLLRVARAGLLAEYQLDQLVGPSDAAVRVRDQVRLCSASDARVLIVGPVGSGRETVARTIHASGARASSVLVPLTSSLLDAELIESAVAACVRHKGEREAEVTATLLLLDVDDLPMDAQKSLADLIKVHDRKLRTLATSRFDLVQIVESKPFRSDLAHLLSTITIELPPLAGRRIDIPSLAQAAVERANVGSAKQVVGLSEEAIQRLVDYDWPGHVTQLFDVVKQAHQRTNGTRIELSDLDDRFLHLPSAQRFAARHTPTIELDHYLEQIEVELIRRAVRQAKQNRAEAARLLGISRSRLLRRMEHFGLDKDDA